MKTLLWGVLFCCAPLLAQTAKRATTKPSVKAAAKSAVTTNKVSAFRKPDFEAYVRHLFVWSPPIQVEISDPKPGPMPGFDEVRVHAFQGKASQDEVFYLSKDGQKIVRGQVFDIKDNPFKSDLDQLKTEFRPSIGTPGAPVVIVAFSDFQCHFCKEEAKTLRDHLLQEYPKEVRMYFMDFPLESVHPWARAAADAGQCVFQQNPGAFWDYHDWIFAHQEEITPENLPNKILDFAKEKQLDSLRLKSCMDSKSGDPAVEKSMAQGQSLNVNSTPTLFVNGRRLPGVLEWNELKRIIDFEINYQKTAKNAGEDCGCEVKLPSYGPK